MSRPPTLVSLFGVLTVRVSLVHHLRTLHHCQDKLGSRTSIVAKNQAKM